MNIEQEIVRRETLFHNASAAEKRVLIARDVIEQIKASSFIPSRGSFLISDRLDTISWLMGTTSLQRILLWPERNPCFCCALGAMMLSCTLFNNKTTLSDMHEITNLGFNIEYDKEFVNEFDKFFSKKQLMLIEIAFEKGGGWFRPDGYGPDESRAQLFGKKYPIDDEARLIAIMENIIENNGEFVP